MCSCATSPRASARWRSAVPPLAPAGGASKSRRSATYPTSTSTTTCAPWTTGAGLTSLATGFGTLMLPTCRCRSCLACCTPSPFGNGETEFADMRAAYDALPDNTKQAIDGLAVEHDIFWSRGLIGVTEFPPGEREQYPPSKQRLVRTHPGSKRKTLY